MASRRDYTRIWLRERELFSSIDAHITGEIDEGLLVVAGFSIRTLTLRCSGAIFEELQDLPKSLNEQELERLKPPESTLPSGLPIASIRL